MSNLLLKLVLVALAAAQAVLPATGRMTGRIVDAATGEPVLGVRVTLAVGPASPPGRGAPPSPSTVSRTALPPPPFPLTTETNANGAFDIPGVPAGRWLVRAQKTGYIMYGANMAPVEISGGTVTIPEIRLDRGGAISGRLLDPKGPA